MTPQRIARILWRRKLVSLVVAGVIALGGAGILLTQPKAYQSTSSIALLPVSANASVLPNYPNLIASLIPTYVQLVSSPVLLDRVARRVPFAASPTQLASEVHAEALSNAAVINIVAQRPQPVQARQLAAATTAVFLTQLKGNGVVIPRVYATPTLPGEPASPRVKLGLAAILALAVILGLGAGLAWDRLSGDPDSPGQPADLTRLPVLGAIPRLGEQLGSASTAANGDKAAQDGWRSLRTNVMRRTGHLLRSVTVTGLSPGGGKTTVAANLAASLAEVGLAVAVVDADVRRPALHELFGLANDQGLTSTVLHGADPASLLRPVSAIPGLHVVTAGPPLPSPRAETGLYRDQLPRFTSLVDLVIVDSPALQDDADATLIARVTDGVVLVVPSGAATLEHLGTALRILKRSGPPVLGTVLTGTSRVVGGDLGDLGSYQASGGLSSMARPRPSAASRPRQLGRRSGSGRACAATPSRERRPGHFAATPPPGRCRTGHGRWPR
jgi:capsular exopolysaccharide synthesis family protein